MREPSLPSLFTVLWEAHAADAQTFRQTPNSAEEKVISLVCHPSLPTLSMCPLAPLICLSPLVTLLEQATEPLLCIVGPVGCSPDTRAHSFLPSFCFYILALKGIGGSLFTFQLKPINANYTLICQSATLWFFSIALI